jgi:hypothetical protein
MYSNYPNGFTNGITIRNIPITIAHPGHVFWVDGSSTTPVRGAVGGQNGNPGTFTQPFATIDFAIGKCLASRGDVIMVKPGHSEDIAAAAGIALDVAGVAIVGLGMGSLRPQITFSETDSTFTVTAANCSVYNVQLVAAVADVVTALSLSAAADGFSMESCWSTEGAVAGTFNFVDVVTMATGANDTSYKDSTFIGNDTNNDAFITGVAHDGLYIDNCRFYANVAQAAAHGLVVTSGNATNVEIKDCSFRSNIDGALWVDCNGAANGGVIKNCVVSSIDTAGATSTGDFTGGHFFECYVSGEADAFGLVGGGGVVYNNA